MVKNKHAIRSVFIILIFTLLSKVMGFFRELTIAAKFGLGTDTDTFFMAISAISMIGNVIIVSLNTTFIPVLTEAETKEGKVKKNAHANNALTISLLLSLVLFVIVEISAPIIVKIIAPGFLGAQMEQLVWYLRFGMPVIFVSATLGITRGYLQSEMRFFDTAVANVAFNIVYLTYLIFFGSKFGISKLIFVHVFAIFTQLLMQIRPLMQVGFRFTPMLDLKDPYIRKMGLLVLPVLGGVAVQDINTIIDKSLASGLVIGSISALNYAIRISTLVQVVFVSAISTVLFPILTRAFSQDDKKTQNTLISKGFVIIVMITFPAMVAFLLLNQQIIQAAFMRGKFNIEAVLMTASALFFYAFGIIPMALRVFLDKVFYSIQDTKTPLYNGIVMLIANFIFSIILRTFMSYRGLALGTSISMTITVGFMLKKLADKDITFINRETIEKTGKVIIASLIMGASILSAKIIGIDRVIPQALLSLLLYSITGSLVYFISLKIMRFEELDWFIQSIFARYRKRKEKPSSSELY